jgi:hypothetical protein
VRILLFVRERKTFELGTQPFTFLGTAEYVEHHGERAVALTWRATDADARGAVRNGPKCRSRVAKFRDEAGSSGAADRGQDRATEPLPLQRKG